MTKIKKPSELSNSPLLKVLVYGQPGIGKSTLALSMPDPLMIDCDRGVHRVEPQFLSDTVEVSSWQDVDDVLSEDLKDYKTVIFDTGSKLIDYMTSHILKENPKLNAGGGQMSLKGYGIRKIMFQNLLGRLHSLGKHVFFVAHEREEKDGDTRFVRPEIGGSSGGDLIKELDIVGYMEAIGQKRVVRFNPQERFYAKNSLRLEDPMPVPDTKDGNQFMQRIIEAYENHVSERSRKAEDYKDLLELIRSNAEDVASAEDANNYIDWIHGLSHVWDSKYQASKALSAKAKELELKFDKAAGRYKDVQITEDEPKEDATGEEQPKTKKGGAKSTASKTTKKGK